MSAGLPSLRNRVAVVTGASRGAGWGIAAALGDAGATVYVTGRSTTARPSPEVLGGTVEESAAGRAIAHLVADPRLMRRSGGVFAVGDLTRDYGFTDVDGRQPEAFRWGGPEGWP